MSTDFSESEGSRSASRSTPTHDEAAMLHKEAVVTSEIVDNESLRKETHGISVTEEQDNESFASHELTQRSWVTTFFRFGPLIGLFGIFLVVMSLFASLAVLVGSNGVPVENWSSIQPSALLAVFTAIGNQSMRFAAWQGIAIAWWVRASRSGSTLGQLHRDWRSGTTFRGALLSGRRIGWLGLACIFSTIVAIDGPLLQRATDVELVPIEGVTVDLEVHISPEIPTDFTGTWSTLPGNQTFSSLWNTSIPTSFGNSPDNIDVVATQEFLTGPTVGWLNGTTMTGFIRGCPGNCTAKVMAPAIQKTSCASHELEVNYNRSLPLPTSAGVVRYPLNSLSFLIQFSLLPGEHESINLVTGLAHARAVGNYTETHKLPACEGHFRYTACTLEPAIGMYDVRISDGAITLLSADPTIIAFANNTRTNNTGGSGSTMRPSTLAGIVSEMANYWGLVAAMSKTDGEYYEYGYGLSAGEIFLENSDVFCFLFRDPQPRMIEEINMLMFRAGAFAASPAGASLPSTLDPGYSYNNSVTGEIEGFHNIYVTTFKWFGAAAVVELVCIALVLPTYYGWWTLGRSVTLSPLEIAKAFDAPALKDCHSNSTAAEMARTVGEVPIRYGASTNDEGLTRLTLGSEEAVQRPQRNAQFAL